MSESSKNSGSRSGFTRRAFLQGSGAVAAATALQQRAETFAADNDQPQVVSGQARVTLNVNGQDHEVDVEPRTTLMDVLRYQLDLTGAKPVSRDGSSGASLVWVDDKTVTSSTVLALECRGKRIRTVESLGGDDPDEVCRAFVAHDAQQCGFCTPGFVVAVRAFLDKHPQATEDEIRAGLNGNLCRCGTYADIVEAVVAVVKGGSNG